MANDVTLKVSPLTKALMEAFAAEHLAETEDSLTNDELIAELVKTANPELYNRIVAKASGIKDKKKRKDSD